MCKLIIKNITYRFDLNFPEVYQYGKQVNPINEKNKKIYLLDNNQEALIIINNKNSRNFKWYINLVVSIFIDFVTSFFNFKNLYNDYGFTYYYKFNTENSKNITLSTKFLTDKNLENFFVEIFLNNIKLNIFNKKKIKGIKFTIILFLILTPILALIFPIIIFYGLTFH